MFTSGKRGLGEGGGVTECYKTHPVKSNNYSIPHNCFKFKFKSKFIFEIFRYVIVLV